MEYESCKRSLEEKQNQILRYENIINTTQIQNRSIEEQLSKIETAEEELISSEAFLNLKTNERNLQKYGRKRTGVQPYVQR